MCSVINCVYIKTDYLMIMKDIEKKPGHCIGIKDDRSRNSKRFHNLTFNNIQAWGQLDNAKINRRENVQFSLGSLIISGVLKGKYFVNICNLVCFSCSWG